MISALSPPSWPRTQHRYRTRQVSTAAPGNRVLFQRTQNPSARPRKRSALQNADGVLQEIYGYLGVHNALRSLIGEVALLFEEDP